MENKETNGYKKKTLKIGIPILIMVGLIVVWIMKNPDFLSNLKQETLVENDVNQIVGEDTNSKEAAEHNVVDNVDFALNVTENIDLEQLKSYGLPIILDFGADTCIPCKEMAPVLEKLNEELKGKAIIRFVDVRKYPELAKEYPISLIPTQLLFDKDGKPYVPSEAHSADMIQYSSKETNKHIITTHEGGITEVELREILYELGIQE